MLRYHRRVRVVVVGAGAAGLATCRELIAAGHVAVVYERSHRVGGTWVYDEKTERDPLGREPKDRVHASMYAALRTNLPRRLMSFRGSPFVQGSTEFPGHADVAAYLHGFAEQHGLLDCIRFGRDVRRVRPLRNDGRPWRWVGEAPPADLVWEVTVGFQGKTSVEHFDAVAVCNGHYTVPQVPHLTGADSYAGRLMHSHSYREPASFADERVVILGARASGVDIARDIASVARRVFLCAREHQGSTTEGAAANIERRATIAALESGDARLTDGTRLSAIDSVVLCTGYRYAFPFVDPAANLVEVEDSDVGPLWLSLLAIRAPTLALVGLPFMVVPFPLFERQAAFFAAVLARNAELPDYATRSADLARERADADRRGVARRHRLRMGDAQVSYANDLARRCGYQELPAWFSPLHEAVRALRRTHPDDYRDRDLPVVGN